MRDLLAVTKALADGNRIRALLAIRRHELCVCQIAELLELAASTVSKHMSVLEQAELVERRKNGRWVSYCRPTAAVPDPAREALLWLDRSLAHDPVIRGDARRLREILKVPVEELCKLNGRGGSSA